MKERPKKHHVKNDPAPALLPGDIEYEMGVPFPGVILPPEQWAATALHPLPEGWMDYDSLFGRKAPRVLEIGCGNGRFIVSSAVRRPDVDHLGIDSLPAVIRYATRRGKQRGLHNTRFAVCDGMAFLKKHCSNASLSEIHVYHPQPFHDSRDHERRLLKPEFFLEVHRVLEPRGLFVLQTDSRAYWEYAQPIVKSFFEWTVQEGPWPEDPHGRSRREKFAEDRKLTVYRGFGTRREDMSIDELTALATTLPQPEFQSEREPASKPYRRPYRRRKN